MTDLSSAPTGQDAALYFEDLQVGARAVSPARTITEADVVLFAGISGDYNPIHTDAVTGAGSPFGSRIAHGLLGTSIASGLFTRTSLSLQLQQSLIAFLGLDWRFVAPLFIGDTIRVQATVVETRESTKPDRGVVVLERLVLKQDDSIAQSGTTSLLVRRRAVAGDSEVQA